MRLSISNIAWDVHEDEAVADLLQEFGVDAIDIAPGKYFSDPKTASRAEISALRAFWSERGIDIIGMQALLFGTSWNLFAQPEDRAAMLAHLGGVCDVAAQLGAVRLVFGSPKNRDRAGLDDVQTEAIAVDFFRHLGDVAAARDVLICLEPNPPIYGANFMTNMSETAEMVQKIMHRSIRMTLDCGAIIINEENPKDVIPAYAELFGHIHLSEPQLATLGRRSDSDRDYALLSSVICEVLPDHIVSIEMRAHEAAPHLGEIEHAVRFAQKFYHTA